jgi:hypothetical protein
MATVTVFDAETMQAIRDGTIVSAAIVNGDLILTKYDGTTQNAGPVLVVKSPNGVTHKIVVDNAGVLSTVVVP